jgi:hypothetical protein
MGSSGQSNAHSGLAEDLSGVGDFTLGLKALQTQIERQRVHIHLGVTSIFEIDSDDWAVS